MKKGPEYSQKRVPIQRFLCFLVPVLAPVLAFWQVAFYQNTLKWDNMDQYFPNRHFISESLAAGVLPFWNPHIQLGLPMAADPQGGVFYPPVIFIASVFGYDLFLFQWEFILHLIWAGLGALLLFRKSGLSLCTAVVFAVVYQLCGPFVSNAQHMTWIVSMAWLPWILASFLALSKGGSWRWSLLLGVSLFASVTGGYPAFLFVWVYILVIWGAVWLITLINNGQNKEAWRFLLNSFYGALTAALLLSGYLFAVVEAMPWVNRGAGIDPERALEGSLQPLALLQLVFPYVNTAPDAFRGFNSMMNIYAGFLLIPLVLLALSSKRIRGRSVFLYLAGCIFMLIAFGEHFPLRGWLYELPLMDLFRFPALFRIFGLTAWIWASARMFNGLAGSSSRKRRLGRILVVHLLIVLVFAFQSWAVSLGSEGGHGVSQVLFSPDTIQDRVATQALWLVPILFLALFFLLRFKREHAVYALGVLLVMDMIASVQFNIRANVIADRNPSELQAFLDTKPGGFPIPDLDRPMLDYGIYNSDEYAPMVYHHTYFTKGFAFEGYYPFSLARLKAFDRHPEKWERLKRPLLFFTERGGDSLLDTRIEVVSWHPDEFVLDVDAPAAGKLVLFQNDYIHWKVESDGEAVKKEVYWDTLLSADLDEGEHRVRIYYSTPLLKFLFFFSQGLFVVCILWLGRIAFVKFRKLME